MKFKFLFPLFLMVFLCFQSFGQTSSRNGYWLPVEDTIRIFIIFAETLNDSSDIHPNQQWEAGFMPSNPDDYADPLFIHKDSIKTWLTNYYYQASFGKFIVLGTILIN